MILSIKTSSRLVQVHAFLFFLLRGILLEGLHEGFHVPGRGCLNSLVTKLEFADERSELASLEATREKAQGLAELKNKAKI